MKWLRILWIICGAVSGAILVLFFVLNLLGWRENMTILSGTHPQGSDAATASFKAMAYMLTYFASVLIVPVLLLTAGISYVWVRFFGGEE